MAQLDCIELAAQVNARKISARQVVADAVERARSLQDKYAAFIHIDADWSRGFADIVDGRVRAGETLPLAGVPFAVKDLIDVKGVPTTCGSKVFVGRIALQDAEVVRRLIGAGAVPIGKLNMHECAFGFTGENPQFGNCRNPWDPARIPGGSSSGSAVSVAAGICPLTLGSDTGGSIRLPASLCGVTGLKPTYGRVSRAGVVPLSWSMDHIGPLTRTAREAARVLRVLAGKDHKDEGSSRKPVSDYESALEASIEGMRIGVPHTWFFEALEPDVATAVTAAIDKLKTNGAEIVDVELPALEAVVAAHRAIIFAEAATYFRPYLAERPADFSEPIRQSLYGGLFLSAVDYLKAQRVRRQLRSGWVKVLHNITCLATPTSPVVAPRFGQQNAELPGGPKPLLRAFLDVTLPFNLLGHPAVSIPCGFSRNNLPIGLQLVAKPFDESRLLCLAHKYQQLTDWHTKTPPV